MIVPPSVALSFMRDRFALRGEGPVFRVDVCPFCRDGEEDPRRQFRRSFSALTGYLKCFVCDRAAHVFSLAKEEAGSRRAAIALLFATAAAPPPPSPLALAELRQASLRLSLSEASVSLACRALESFTPDWSASPYGADILAYARQRGLREDWLFSGRVGTCRRGPLAGRLVLPVWSDGVPVFACARAIRPEVAPKYVTPSPNWASVGAGEVVYDLDLVEEGELLALAEGAISARHVTQAGAAIGIAALGKTLTRRQAALIASRRPAHVVVLREQGVPEETAAAAADLLFSFGVPSSVAALGEADPADAPPEDTAQRIASAVPGDGLSALRAAARKL